GDINIKVTNGSLNIEDSAALSTRTWGDGNAGNVNIDVSDNVKIDFADIFSSVISQNGNQAGDININANSVEVVNGSSVGSSIFGIGNAGNININATNKVRIDGLSSDGEFRSSISADVSNIIENSEGNGGNIKIETQLFDMNDGLLSVGNSGIGNPGNINIHTDTISLNSSSIRASAFSENAGNVNLQASGDVSLKDSLISTSLFFGNGKGGDITIDAKSLFLTDFSSLGGFQGSDTTSEGSAGNITVKTDEFVTLDNSSSISVSANRGFGGEILIDTKKLSVQNGSQITANVLGDKPAASLTVNATESVEVSGFANSLESALSIRTSGDGDAGTLTINTGKLIVKDGASISTSGSVLFSDLPEQLLNDLQASQLNIGGAGKGGNLEINASESVQIIGSTPDGLALSSLVSNGEGGDGG
ncbi:MAG: hypothetical protein MJK14_15855, partial [Rivularia sp. ALOHA_DT_140]|nr:hypothetical protein [Rivularia sp. ALOHA_DT_140]